MPTNTVSGAAPDLSLTADELAAFARDGYVLRRNLFADWRSSLTTVLLLALAVYLLPGVLQWSLFQAVFGAHADACQAARGNGACWGVITEKWRIIIFGRYPFEEQWRPEVATLLMVAGLVVSCIRWFWRPWLALLWVGVLAVFFALMRGGVLGLSPVRTDLWGGLPLTVMLSELISAARAQFW